MLKRMRSFLVLVMLFIAVTMSAQVTTATMSGKVTAQDEPIIGATVVAMTMSIAATKKDRILFNINVVD